MLYSISYMSLLTCTHTYFCFEKQAQRVGRGPGSGRGKTCGRGHKGQVYNTIGKIITLLLPLLSLGPTKQDGH